MDKGILLVRKTIQGFDMVLDPVDRVDDKLIRKGAYDQRTADFLNRNISAGGTFINIGAHHGYFSLIGGSRAGKGGNLIAVEPDRVNYSILQENIERNVSFLGSSLAIWAGAWDKKATLRLAGSGSLSQIDPDPKTDRPGEAIDLFPIDEIPGTAGVIDCMKIDAQGAEIKILRGAQKTLEETRALIVEYWPAGIAAMGDAPGDMIPLLKKADFRVCMYSSGIFIDATQRDLDAATPGPRHCINLYCKNI
jgi:FkbM family methyltransferase